MTETPTRPQLRPETAHPARTPGARAGRPAGAGSGSAPPTLTPAGLGTVLLGIALPTIDYFVVNVALPSINRSLHTSSAALELVVAGYGTTYALLLVLGGRLGDALGRRRFFRIGLAAFTLTSLVCGLAPDDTTLVVARATQGASAAMLLPQVLSTIQATTTGERRARALGLYGAVAGLSIVVGQLAGGLLVSLDIAGTGWRPIFLVNVPVGLTCLILAGRTVPETRSSHPAHVDGAGTVAFAVALLALLVPLAEGRTLGWPVWSWLSLALAPVAGAAFVAVERQVERRGLVPLLPPSLLRIPSLRHGLLLVILYFVGFGGFLFAFAVTLQDVLGMGSLGAGVALLPLAVGFSAASLLSGRLVNRWRGITTAGAVLAAVGFAVMVAATYLTWPGGAAAGLAPGLAVAGIGEGMVVPTLFRAVLSEVPVERAGAGSGVLATTQQTAMALGVTTIGSLFLALSAGGARDAFVVVLAVQVVVGVAIAAFGRVLPDPRR